MMKISGLWTLLGRGVVILAAGWSGWAVWKNLQDYPRTDDAEVRANLVGVAPQVGGSIVRFYVVDNQVVKRGDRLFEIDARPYEAEANRARAKLENVRLEVRGLEEEVKAAEATLRVREARASYTASHYERLKPLLKGNFTSADRVELAGSEAESASAMVREGEAAVGRARSKLGIFEGRNTLIAEAEASLGDAELKLSYCKVFAPCDGPVTNLQTAAGAYVAAGQALFSIVDLSEWYVLANFRETDLGRIAPGQRVKVFLMADRDTPFVGTVQGIARAVYPLATPSRVVAGGEGILSRIEPTIDFVQLAQRFPVRVVIEGGAGKSFRMGGKAAVIVDVRAKREADGWIQNQPGKGFTSPLRDE